jgi:hypothetical protein
MAERRRVRGAGLWALARKKNSKYLNIESALSHGGSLLSPLEGATFLSLASAQSLEPRAQRGRGSAR